MIDDSTLVSGFTLTVTGTYAYGHEKFTTSIDQKYLVKSLFSDKFLELEIREKLSSQHYKFRVK